MSAPLWELPSGEQVLGLEQVRATVGADCAPARWVVNLVYAPGSTRVVATNVPQYRGGKPESPPLVAEWESSMELPRPWDRGEADCILTQVLVEWFGVDEVTTTARAQFFVLQPVGGDPEDWDERQRLQDLLGLRGSP